MATQKGKIMLNYLLSNSLLPKVAYRIGIYYQIKDRLNSEKKLFDTSHGDNKTSLISSLKNSEIALSTKEANSQHYEVPTDFYRHILGPKLKYSCCYYQNAKTLVDAETEMLDLYCKRAGITNEQNILDLGCGWGSFTLYAANKFPDSQFTAVSNSSTQKKYIDDVVSKHRLKNVITLTEDVNNLQLNEKYDRVVSIEMFEHVRNYQHLLEKISSWLCPQGKLFIHHFCHQYLTYPFNPEDSWMAKHFFKNGLMPSEDLLLFFNDHLVIDSRWRVNGKHYAKTCDHWLENLYQNKNEILSLFNNHYDNPKLQYEYWDLFIRACAQLFAFNSGNEWFVTHCLFKKR
jgi:cyclopropane-fatty-acyl-phospholipid synthase